MYEYVFFSASPAKAFSASDADGSSSADDDAIQNGH